LIKAKWEREKKHEKKEGTRNEKGKKEKRKTPELSRGVKGSGKG